MATAPEKAEAFIGGVIYLFFASGCVGHQTRGGGDVLRISSAVEDPPCRADDQNQTDGERCEEGGELFHGLLSRGWLAGFRLAIGQMALHCATTSRAEPSHLPHCVAMPSSNWISSKPIPARA